MQLLGKMAVLFSFMIIGYFCYKRKYMTKEAAGVISFIVLNIACPAMIISGTVNREGDIPGGLMPTVIAATIMYAVLIVIAVFLPLLLRVEKKDRGVYRLMTIFSNIGFMGFPVAQAMFGDASIMYVTIFQIPYNLLIYSYGIYILTSNQEGASGFQWKKMINIGMISAILAIVLYVFDWKVPAFIGEATESLGAMTAPLSMIVIGIALAQIPLRSLFTDVRLLFFTAVKLLLIPILGMLVCKRIVEDEILLGVLMIMLSVPVGSMTAMLAEQYGGDTELTSKGVALTTLLSVVTIPLVGAIML